MECNHKFSKTAWKKCPECFPGEKTIFDEAMEKLDITIAYRKKIEAQINLLKTQFLYKQIRENEISKMSEEYEDNKRTMKEMLENIKSKSFYHVGLHIKIREHKAPKVLDLGAFMKWAMVNVNKEEFENLFMPKNKSLKEFVNERFEKTAGVESVLFDGSIPGLESKTNWTTINIKEHE